MNRAAPVRSLPDLVIMDALAVSKLVKARQVSCREVMQTYLDHIEQFNPNVNAIVSLQPRDALLKQANERDEELARGDYRGWMHGLPHAVKDLVSTCGIRTTLGSPLVDMVPEEDAIFVERLRHNGAIIIGKTNRALAHPFRYAGFSGVTTLIFVGECPVIQDKQLCPGWSE